MINGGLAAIKQGFDNVGYIDGDISIPIWENGLNSYLNLLRTMLML